MPFRNLRRKINTRAANDASVFTMERLIGPSGTGRLVSIDS